MTSATAPAAQVADSANEPKRTRWSRIADHLVRRRVRITNAIFVFLLVEDLLTGVHPHDIFDRHDPKTLLGCGLIFAGLALRTWSAGILRKTRELTTSGPYALIRNPLYVGSFLIMCGYSTLIDHVENLFVILGPLAGLYFLQVLHEERLLAKLYESRWTEYVRTVPRFLPRSFPASPLASWEFSQWLGSREYRALGAALLGMLALQYFHIG
jgi:protein-S-isoprenylcysteine O-methyltransferase Ste14